MFSKAKVSKEITVSVTHPWHPGVQFEFDFPKVMPKPAEEVQKQFYGLTDEDRAKTVFEGIVGIMANMIVRAPRPFADFPEEGSLVTRFKDYFVDETHPELRQIIFAVWERYGLSAVPEAYIKSVPHGRVAGNLSPRASGESLA